MVSDISDGAYRVRAERGFSLMELLVVVAIVAILAAIAIPAYGRYAYRAHRVDGQSLLLRIADAEERYYTGNNHYGSLIEIGYADPAISEQQFYSARLNVSSDSTDSVAQVFAVSASPTGAQSKDACGQLTISSSGIKMPGPSSSLSNVNGPCW